MTILGSFSKRFPKTCIFTLNILFLYKFVYKMSWSGFKRIFRWGPLIALGLIKSITWSTFICIEMWWPPKTLGGSLNMLCFMSLSGLTMYNFLSTMFHGPGYLPLKWTPTNPDDCQFLQQCGVCFGYKAPRAHHCRKCGRCVLKMDHHCPWINNCVGWGNHAHFVYFLLFSTLGGLHASIILGCSIYRALYSRNYVFYKIENVPLVHLNGPKLYMAILSVGFAAGVTIAVGMLLVVQVRSILINQTGIEDWIMAKAKCRRQNSNTTFIFPYDLGWWHNIKQVLTFTGHPVGDGIYWPVREGCTQYMLTIEQIEQKYDKKLKSRLYRVIKSVSGYWLPIVHGTDVCCNVPLTDEPRLKLNIGDTVRVTRWRKHWLFGEKIQPDLPEGQESLLRQRGWFPKPCVTLLVEVEHIAQMNNEKKIN